MLSYPFETSGSSLSTELAVASIGFAGAVAGAFVNAYSAELRALVTGRLTRNRDLVGDWVCTWETNTPEKRPPIKDSVTIETAAGEKIRAVAHTPGVGRYRLTGRLSQSSLMTVFYEGQSDRHPLGGVVILELNVLRNEMRGYWHEYGPDRTMIGGTTIWRKGREVPE